MIRFDKSVVDLLRVLIVALCLNSSLHLLIVVLILVGNVGVLAALKAFVCGSLYIAFALGFRYSIPDES